jgi:hypothetical protein
MSDEPEAWVETRPDGSIILHDPTAEGVIQAVKSYNRGIQMARVGDFLKANQSCIPHFSKRVKDRGLSPSEVVLVILDVDDPNGSALADILMPGYDWDSIRRAGQAPVARGLASRSVLGALEALDKEEVARFRQRPNDLLVVVVTAGIFRIYPV